MAPSSSSMLSDKIKVDNSVGVLRSGLGLGLGSWIHVKVRVRVRVGVRIRVKVMVMVMVMVRVRVRAEFPQHIAQGHRAAFFQDVVGQIKIFDGKSFQVGNVLS